MGIDVLVGSLSDLWRDETRERLAVFAEAAAHMTEDPATFPSRKWRRQLARVPVDGFMSALRARLGDPVSWREELTGDEPAHVGNLAPNGMPCHTRSSPRGSGAVCIARSVAQLAWLDIDNVFLPVDVARVLGGFPHVVGSAPVLERELADVSKHADARLRDDAVKHNLVILGIAIAKATHRSVPMFVHG